MNTDLVSGAVLGDLLNVDTRAIQRWCRAGVIIRAGKNNYRLRDSVRGYTKHLQEMAGGRLGHDPAVDLIGASAKLKTEQAELAKTRRLILSGSVIEVTRILPAWQRAARAIRQACLSIPSRCRWRLPHWSSYDQNTVDEEIRSVLTQLGENPPVMDDADIDAPESDFKPRYRMKKVS
jgi:terminase small subunit / prophage DNA-packing protein